MNTPSNNIKLSLGFSPCPNDTFIFEPMLLGLIDTEGLTFEVNLHDVEELNKRAFSGALDITKLSYHAFAYLIDIYQLLDSGSALGQNCGPLLICKDTEDVSDLINKRVAIPGKYTTASFLLNLYAPGIINREEMLFSDIEYAVQNAKVDAGVIIHENRFTYHLRGLKKIADLGEFWEEKTGMPIPLGGIAIRRSLSPGIKQKFNRVLRRSVEYALENKNTLGEFVKQNAQEMSEEIILKHIDLYVNDYTLNLGEKGRQAIEYMYKKARELKIIPETDQKIFLS